MSYVRQVWWMNNRFRLFLQMPMNIDHDVFGPQWFESERQRLINLRDRASEKGRKKEYPFLSNCITIYFVLSPCGVKKHEKNSEVFF